MAGMEWTDERPKLPGWYWLSQPAGRWPSMGEVLPVQVVTIGSNEDLRVRVPGLDFDEALWLRHVENARWQGPFELPAPPRRGE